LPNRNRGSNCESVDMSNEMVNYSNNSYRMGDSDGGLVRVQSISHRQHQQIDDQSFHKEREVN
jgi:hypothetical protein